MAHTRYFCHQCQNEFTHAGDTTPSCPQCNSDFVELVTELTFTREERHQRLAAQRATQFPAVEHPDDGTSSITNAGDSSESGRRRTRPVDGSNVIEDESSTTRMLFGPNGIFGRVIPVIFPLPTEEETDDEYATIAAASTMETHNAGPAEQGRSTDNHEEEEGGGGDGTQGGHRRRQSFSQLMGSIVPRILRSILHLRPPQPINAAEGGREGGMEASAGGETGRTRRLPGTTFSFTTGTGEQGHARVTVVSADEYTHALSHL